MKILVFVESFMHPTQLFIYNEIVELSKSNDVLLLTTKRVIFNNTDFPFENITVIPFTPNKISRKLNWVLEQNDISLTRKNNTFRKKVDELIKAFKPDVIHGHFGYESLILLENLKNPPCPLFVSFHGYDASEMLNRKCYVKKLNYHIERLNITPIYVSNYMRNDMEKAGIHLKNARLLYYGTDTDYFKPAEPIQSSKYTFLQVSSFHEKKGHIYTLQAFKKLLEKVPDKNKYKLVFAGGGPLFEEVKGQTKDLELLNYVEFTDTITYRETYPLLQQANAFLHHSLTASTGMKEGIPNAIMEAMAMELPIISTWHAGIPELVEDEVNGYLVKEKDVDSYVKRMHDILSWGQQPQNRKKIEDIFSRQAHNKNLLNIYGERLSNRATVS